MNNEQMVEFALDNVQTAMKGLEGVEGVRRTKRIIEEIKINDDLMEITILHNMRFEMHYSPRTKKIEFSTTYSNQDITDEYMNEMMTINQAKNLIESNIRMAQRVIKGV